MISLDRESCYQAVLSHDRRFDGSFFVAVKSTGVYCRTVCTARTPSLKNCSFYLNAATAESEGFRPCLRCRPELAPGSAPLDAQSRCAELIADLLEAGALNEMSVAQLAAFLNLSEWQLRRLVEKYFSVSPVELAITQRLLLAKRLLKDSDLSITEVAYASGFNSLRRFNSLLKERYGMSPARLRARRNLLSSPDKIRCRLYFRPPYDFVALLSFLGKRSAGGVEIAESGCYARTVSYSNYSGCIMLSPAEDEFALELTVDASLSRVLMPIIAKVKRLFDLNASPELINRKLKDLSAPFPGLRLPGAFDTFETAVRAILGQEITVKAATTLVTRFAEKFGQKIETSVPGLNILFPTVKDAALLSVSDFKGLGIRESRARTIICLAGAIAGGAISLEQAIDPYESMSRLQEISGIGPWTAQYIAMRCYHFPDAFPEGDLGIARALSPLSWNQIIELSESWRPWRAYAAMHLWKKLEN
ncbi:MAG: helix-turn-helix domain-containing protein [Candidatus Obscuribacterales bacterium]|nr:helix-turn-helix domain-containing protein [Candidatus Obscuribacterales bacterium]